VSLAIRKGENVSSKRKRNQTRTALFEGMEVVQGIGCVRKKNPGGPLGKGGITLVAGASKVRKRDICKRGISLTAGRGRVDLWRGTGSGGRLQNPKKRDQQHSAGVGRECRLSSRIKGGGEQPSILIKEKRPPAILMFEKNFPAELHRGRMKGKKERGESVWHNRKKGRPPGHQS